MLKHYKNCSALCFAILSAINQYLTKIFVAFLRCMVVAFVRACVHCGLSYSFIEWKLACDVQYAMLLKKLHFNSLDSNGLCQNWSCIKTMAKSRQTIVSFNFSCGIMQIESGPNSLNRTIYSLYIQSEYKCDSSHEIAWSMLGVCSCICICINFTFWRWMYRTWI